MKLNFDPALSLQREGIGNIVYGNGSAAGGGGTVTGANNGLELTGAVVQLGQTVGQGGNPAILLSTREIPLGGFSLNLKNTVAAGLVPQINFTNSAGANIANLRVDDDSSIFFGLSAGIATGGPVVATVVIGNGAGNAVTNASSRNTLIGCNAGAVTVTTGSYNTIVGFDAGNGGGVLGSQNTLIGSQISDGSHTFGNANTIIGAQNMPQANADWTIGDHNIMLGTTCVLQPAVSNSTIISGQGNANFGVQLSNTIVLGFSDQKVIIGPVQSIGAYVQTNSQLTVWGAISLPQVSTAVNYTQLVTDSTIIFTATGTMTMLTAANCINRIITIVAQGVAVVTTSMNYTNLAGASVNTVAAGTSVVLQANLAGTVWTQIK
jgi:hypothetical protein